MTAEFIPPPSIPSPDTRLAEMQRQALDDALDMAKRYDPYLHEQQLDKVAFNERNRPRLSLATATFLRHDIESVNELRSMVRHEPPVPTLPQSAVEYNLRDIALERREAPAQREALARRYIQPALNPHKYRVQVGRLILFGQVLRHHEHPFAGCASDVLMAYGKTIAELPR